MAKQRVTQPVPIERIASSIQIVRGRRVLLDADLAALYGVTTARLNQQVRRNLERFPADFMFRLTAEEHRGLMLQIATSKPGRGGRRKPPLTELERLVDSHDTMIVDIMRTIRQLTNVPQTRAIGFVELEEKKW